MSLTETELRERFPNASEAFLKANGIARSATFSGHGDYWQPPTVEAVAWEDLTIKESLIVPKRPRQSAKPPKQSESREQQALVVWWDAVGADKHGLESHDLMAFPLQGARTARNGARMKAEGMRAGTLDLLVAVPAGDYAGLWIELKAGKGRASPAQKAAMERLNRRGYLAVLCVGRTEAQAVIEEYLKWRAA